MAYGMKYTKGGFPFKSSPAKQSKKNEYNRENNQTADNSGPVRPVNQTVASKSRKLAQGEQVNDLESKAAYVETDIENEKVSSKKGNEIIKELNSKADKLRVAKKKIKPSYPATPKGSKQRSAAEQTLEKKEDAAGQN